MSLEAIGEQAGHGESGQGLAAPGLTHDADDLCLVYPERDPRDRHPRIVGRADGDAEVLDFQDRHVHAVFRRYSRGFKA